jgi:hypothetical protein
MIEWLMAWIVPNVLVLILMYPHWTVGGIVIGAMAWAIWRAK